MNVRSLCRLAVVLVLPSATAQPVAAAGATLPVSIERFVGLPADSLDRGELLVAFRAAMDADLPCEKRVGEAWTPSGPRRNLFRIVDAAPPDAAWLLDLEIGVPPQIRVAQPKPRHERSAPRPRMSGLRASRGLIVVVTATSPTAASRGAPGEPERFAVYFAGARRVIAPSAKVAGGAYQYPWGDVGRVVALAALETMHRATGALSVDERADLTPATRQEEKP